MSSGVLPNDWESTLTPGSDESTWLNDSNLPCKSALDMARDLEKKYESAAQAVGRMFVDHTEIPISYLHWWCHVYCTKVHADKPLIDYWLKVAAIWAKQDNSVESKSRVLTGQNVIGMFKLWLDILFLDITLYDNENIRPNVPRLVNNTIRWHSKTIRGTKTTRLETLRYIINEGYALFEERGWKEGKVYWENECKRFSVLC